MDRSNRRMSISNVDDDEILLGTVYKHLFGIIIIYIQAILGLLLSLGLAFFLLPSVFEDSSSAITLATLFAVLATIFAGLIVLMATIIYRQSHLTITDKNITQVLQGGLFQRKVSQLTMANVEDVTSEQRGFFASIFDFGVLKIETAGEQTNFIFSFCPKPSYYAKVILEAREKFVRQDYSHSKTAKANVLSREDATR